MVQAPFSSRPRTAQASASPPLSLAEIGATVAAGLVPLPAESAGYLLLGLADQLVRAPLPLDERGVLLSPEGNVALLSLTTTSRRANADERTLEGQLRDLLRQMLSYAPGKAPALSAVAQRTARGSLAALITEIEAALIPVNRSAGRRALARLQREVERERHRVPAAAPRSSPRVRSASAASPMPPRAASPVPPRVASPMPPRAASPVPPRAAPARVVSPVPPRAVASRTASPVPPSVRPQAPAAAPARPAPRSVVAEMLAPHIPSLIPPDTAMRVFASPRPAAAQVKPEAASPLPPGAAEARPAPAHVAPSPVLDDATELRAPAVVAVDEVRESIAPVLLAPSALPPAAEQVPTPIEAAAVVPAALSAGHDDPITTAPPPGPSPEPVAAAVEPAVAVIEPAVAVVEPPVVIEPAVREAPVLTMEVPDGEAVARPSRESVSPPPVASVRPSVRPASVRPGRTAGARTPAVMSVASAPSPMVARLAGDGGPATVEQLLERFAPSDGLSEREVSRQLKQAVGVELSALPPGVETLMPPTVVWSEEPHAQAPRVEHAMEPLPTYEPRPPRRPRATMLFLMVLVLVGLGAMVATWLQAPGFFLGHRTGAAGAAIDAPPGSHR